MRRIIICALISAFCIPAMVGQEGLVGFFERPSTETIPKDLQSITSTVYSGFSMDESKEPDTTIVVNGESKDLYITSTYVKTFPDDNTYEIKYFDKKGDLTHTEKTHLDKNGRIIQKDVIPANPNLSHMSSSRKYTYDNDRLIAVVENDIPVVSSTYDGKENLPTTIELDAQFFKFICNRENTSSGYRYVMTPAAGDDSPMSQMFIEKMKEENTKIYMDYEQKDELHTFTYIEADASTGEVRTKSVYVRDADYRLVEAMEEEHTHKKIAYAENGEIAKITDIKSGEVLENVFDPNGRLIREYVDYSVNLYTYDSDGHRITEIQGNSSGNEIIQATFHQITKK